MRTDLMNEITATYQKHGWELKSVLLRRESLKDLRDEIYAATGKQKTREAAIDALWFSRPSHNKGEAWELRLLAETPYALFQRFDADEPQEKRAQAMQEMEERMTQYVTGG
jgi:hypothetical protein